MILILNLKTTKEKCPPHLPQTRQSPELYSYYGARDEFACGGKEQGEEHKQDMILNTNSVCQNVELNEVEERESKIDYSGV